MKILKKFLASAAALTCIIGAAPAYPAVKTLPASAAQAEVYAAEEQVFSSIEDAAVFVRAQLTARNPDFTVLLSDIDPSAAGDVFFRLIELAVAETGVSNEGDYLAKSLMYRKASIHFQGNCLALDYHVDYRTDAEQEQYVADRIAEILASLDLDGKSDYEKILAVYTWVTANVSYTYDFDNELVYTAYNALYNGCAVCQGYSMLTYRMLRELGVSARIITGTGAGGGGHAWLIAEADRWYYYLDPTYDGGHSPERFRYFMKGYEDFDSGSEKHIPDTGDPNKPNTQPDFTSAEFTAAYPIHDTAYDPDSPAYRPILGDADLNGYIDGFDCTAMREGILYGFDSERAELSADLNGDGYVKLNDLILLQSFLTGKITSFPTGNVS